MRWAIVAVLVGVLATSAGAAVPGEARAIADLCARAATLRDAGFESDAVGLYKTALERSPASPCAKQGLHDGPPLTLGSVLDDIAELVPRLLLAVAVLLLALFCVLLLGHIRPLHRRLVRVPGLGRMLSPRLTLASLGDGSGHDIGATLDARIRMQLAESRRLALLHEGPAYEMDRSTPAEDFAELVAGDSGLKSALEKASESSDQLKIVASVLTLLYTLLPTQRLTVSGIVEPVTGPCATATLYLDDGGRPVAAATLRGSIPDIARDLTAADFVELAAPAAIWVQYEVARAIRRDMDRGPDAAVSYALVREGMEKQRAGDVAGARSRFSQARELDDRNWAASLNLAMTEARLANDYERAIEILDCAFQAIQHASPQKDRAPGERPHIADADYYRLGYQLAAQLMNRAAAPQDRRRGQPSGAAAIINQDPLAVARQLLDDAAIVRRSIAARSRSRLRRRRPAPQEYRLQTFLAETIEPCCALIAARRLHQLGRADEAQPLVDDVLGRARRGELSYRAYYSLACLEANDGDDSDAILYLSRALYKAPRARRAELAEWAQSDPGFASLRVAVHDLVAPLDASAPAPASTSTS